MAFLRERVLGENEEEVFNWTLRVKAPELDLKVMRLTFACLRLPYEMIIDWISISGHQNRCNRI